MEHLGYTTPLMGYFLFILSSQMSRIWNGPVGDNSVEKGCLFWVSKFAKVEGAQVLGEFENSFQTIKQYS